MGAVLVWELPAFLYKLPAPARQGTSHSGKGIGPQGLKPTFFPAGNGTTEVVPFPKPARNGVFPQPAKALWERFSYGQLPAFLYKLPASARQGTSHSGKGIGPQGLKPTFLPAGNGTTEVVPFPNPARSFFRGLLNPSGSGSRMGNCRHFYTNCPLRRGKGLVIAEKVLALRG